MVKSVLRTYPHCGDMGLRERHAHFQREERVFFRARCHLDAICIACFCPAVANTSPLVIFR